MKKYLLLSLSAIFAASMAFAQQGNVSLTEPDPTMIGNDSAEQALQTIVVENFEREGSWTVRMSLDAGVITGRLFQGGPAAKEEEKELVKDSSGNVIEDDVGENNHSLGLKAEFFRRGINSIYLTAVRPLPIEGVTKTLSVWVAGRNMNHSLYVLVQDYFGHNFELYVGSLAFSSWKKLTVAIPPSVDGVHGIVQSSPYHGDRPGLKVLGFRIDCDPETAVGSYYVYFDALHAVTDLYDMQNRDLDDMDDNW